MVHIKTFILLFIGIVYNFIHILDVSANAPPHIYHIPNKITKKEYERFKKQCAKKTVSCSVSDDQKGAYPHKTFDRTKIYMDPHNYKKGKGFLELGANEKPRLHQAINVEYDVYNLLPFSSQADNSITEFETEFAVPESMPAGVIEEVRKNNLVIFIWPGLQPAWDTNNAFRSSILQPVLALGNSCAPNSPSWDAISGQGEYEDKGPQWWISAQYVLTPKVNFPQQLGENGSTTFTEKKGCNGGYSKIVQPGDKIKTNIYYDDASGYWVQEIFINGVKDERLTYRIQLNDQAKIMNRAFLAIEFYVTTTEKVLNQLPSNLLGGDDKPDYAYPFKINKLQASFAIPNYDTSASKHYELYISRNGSPYDWATGVGYASCSTNGADRHYDQAYFSEKECTLQPKMDHPNEH